MIKISKFSGITSFFKDDEGSYVIWQWPNLPLVGWFVCFVLAIIFSDYSIKSTFQDLSRMFLFLWAYLEIKSGLSSFRKLLGVVVMVLVVITLFK